MRHAIRRAARPAGLGGATNGPSRLRLPSYRGCDRLDSHFHCGLCPSDVCVSSPPSARPPCRLLATRSRAPPNSMSSPVGGRGLGKEFINECSSCPRADEVERGRSPHRPAVAGSLPAPRHNPSYPPQGRRLPTPSAIRVALGAKQGARSGTVEITCDLAKTMRPSAWQARSGLWRLSRRLCSSTSSSRRASLKPKSC